MAAATGTGRWSMSSAQAHNYIIDPLTAPQPSEETGLNTHFRNTLGPAPVSSTNVSEFSIPRNSDPLTPPRRHSRGHSLGAPPPGVRHSRASSNASNRSTPNGNINNRLSRGNSLSQRFPGDMSHRPLDMLKKHETRAHRSPHLRKTSIPGVDMIDSLDRTTLGAYHHEGPYDATLISRNATAKYSPVAAVADTNNQALKATPPERIADAVERHRPLDGVAAFPPGVKDPSGRTYDYEETNLQTDGPAGDYKKLPGEDLNDDQKRALERRKKYEIGYDGKVGAVKDIELEDQPHATSKSVQINQDEVVGNRKRHSLSGLKKRLSLRRRKS